MHLGFEFLNILEYEEAENENKEHLVYHCSNWHGIYGLPQSGS